MSFLSEAHKIPHRRHRNIPKSPPAAATESTIQDQDRIGITDRHLPVGGVAASASPSTKRERKRGIDSYGGRGSFLLAETLLGGYFSAMVEAIRGSALPALVPWTIIFSLIFGGCCSNVFALEKIVKEKPGSGFLITFVQFAVTALFTWPTHFSASHPPFFLKPRAIPMVRWLPSIALFFIVNMLNNFAFGYNISVPVHIILRSGGSLMSMLVGYAWGKRYTNMQIFSVGMLTMGIITAAMADAQSKGKKPSSSSTSIDYSFITGLVILAMGQLLSAIMGLYTQLTYASYGSHWHENLFYSHFLSLPLFLPFFPSLLSELENLSTTAPISVFSAAATATIDTNNRLASSPSSGPGLPSISSTTSSKHITTTTIITFFLRSKSIDINIKNISVPSQLLNLAANALTQYICIRGVNLLSARTSALGVTIALNVRKLISLFLSIWLFGNELPHGVLVGAVIVFGSAGVWAVEGQRLKNGGGVGVGWNDKAKDKDKGPGPAVGGDSDDDDEDDGKIGTGGESQRMLKGEKTS